jgi:hypothetical protein
MRLFEPWRSRRDPAVPLWLLAFAHESCAQVIERAEFRARPFVRAVAQPEVEVAEEPAPEPCPDIELLVSRSLDGRLGWVERVRLAEHLAACAECAELVATQRTLSEALRALGTPGSLAERWRRG